MSEKRAAASYGPNGEERDLERLGIRLPGATTPR